MIAEDVSRETLDLLHCYVALLSKWTRKINLIAPSTEGDIWSRHIDDCLDALACLPTDPRSWVDIGSGAGLPGIIAAIRYRDNLENIALVESDKRKCAFLRTVIRELCLDCDVHAERIEQARLDTPEIMSARALAPLERLLDLTRPHHASDCTFLFMKGRNWQQEVDKARLRYDFKLAVHPSVAETGSATLLISEVQVRD